MNVQEKAEKWLNSNIDKDTRVEIEGMLNSEDNKELTEAFYKDLEFGTGGLRGIMGVGSNRINKYTIGKATQGLANYLNKTFPSEEIKVAIAFDSRNNSEYFAGITADVFSANGIYVYLFESLRPTPELSFAIREFKCKSGVVLTASHNPKEYNGYKAYWDDGGQVTPPHDKNIIDEVNSIENLDSIRFVREPSKVEIIGQETDDKYIEVIRNLSLSPEIIEQQANLKIVFSPIHGTGSPLVPQCLKAIGFTNVHVVEEQEAPNGNFPTVVYPNPEEADAMMMAMKKAGEIDADLVMATDPDADRVGIAVKNNIGEFTLLNGNQTGSLLIYYLLKRYKERNLYKGNEFVVKTIVTTELIEAIAKSFGVTCYNTLTGFKYIATLIRELEGKEKFIGGGEESYGYLIGDSVRDKDAIASCAIIAEMTAWAMQNGKSLYQLLEELYNTYGLYIEGLKSLTRQGKEGAEEIDALMAGLRSDPPKILGGSPVVEMVDYQGGFRRNIPTGEEHKINFPASNVLQFYTEDGSKISARPSGTEPKIKFYFGVKQEKFDDLQKAEKTLREKIDTLADELMK